MISIHNTIKRYKIRSEKDLLKIGPNRYGELLNDISHILVQSKNKSIEASPSGLSLCLKFNKQTLPFITPSRLDVLAKKLSVYSALSLVEIPGLIDSQLLDFHRYKGDKNYQHTHTRKFFNNFIKPYLILEKHIDNNLVQLLPTGFGVPQIHLKDNLSTTYNYNRRDDLKLRKLRKRRKRSSTRNISKSVLSKNINIIYPKRSDLISNLFEDIEFDSNLKQIYLLLPYIKSVNVEEIRRIKEDNFDNLTMFYRSTEKFFNESTYINSEDKLLDLMKEVDYETRRLESLYQQLIKKRRIKGIEITTGLSIMALSLMVPTEIATTILGAIGGVKALDGVWYLGEKSNIETQLKQNDFYIPWYISTVSKKA